MRILLISQFFDPEPHLKGLALAQALRAYGHEVEVLTGFPNYPGGKLYAGHRVRFREDGFMDGIPVRRSFLYPSHDRSALRRILNYVSFAVSAAVNVLSLRRPDVVYLYTPPMTAALPAVALRYLKGVPFVADVQDLWPDTLAATGMVREGLVTTLIGAWTNFVFRKAARLTVLSKGFDERLRARGIRTPISVVPNWAPREIVDLRFDSDLARSEDRFEVLFAGTMGRAQALDTVLDAAALLAKEAPQVTFRFVGGGVEVDALKTRATRLGLANARFEPPVPVGAMAPIFAAADCLLVHLKDDPLFRITIPSKVQAYLAVGKPVLIGVRGDAADMVAEAGAGLAFEPENARALANAVLAMVRATPEARRTLGESGRRYYDHALAFDASVARIAGILEGSARRGAQ